MGGERQSDCVVKSPPGVEIRRYKSGKATIRIRFYYKGMECRETINLEVTKSNISYATRLRAEIINRIARNNFHYEEFFPNSKNLVRLGLSPTKVKFGKLLDDFLLRAKDTLEWSSYSGYKKVADTHLYPAFGEMMIQDLKPAVLRAWIGGLNRTAKTIANIMLPLRAVIGQALNDELIDSNPFDKIVVSKLINKQTKKSNFKVDPFDRQEIGRILESAHHQQIRNLFQFAFFSGLRTSELIGLEWSDVDWLRGMLRVTRAVVKKRVKQPKTEAGQRNVLLLPPAVLALESQKDYTFGTSERIFYNPSTGRPWDTDHQIRRTAWIPALKKASVRYRNPYQTRHTFASMLLSAGENPMWVATQMGHVDMEMVMRTYGKWIPDSRSLSGYKLINDWGNILPVRPADAPEGVVLDDLPYKSTG